MKFLRSLFGKSSVTPATKPNFTPKPQPDQVVSHHAPATPPAAAPAPQVVLNQEPEGPATTEILQGLAEKLKEPAKTGIWDLEGGEEKAAEATPARAPARSRRNKTRLIGFDTSEGGVVDLFKSEDGEDAPVEEAPNAADAITFPVGWALVIKGPGRGHSFALGPGMSSIGRGADQAVRLDFGDTSISRSSHAAIVYDVEKRTFLLGQGGKSNIVRLNGKPVISNEDIKEGDEIKIGETVLRLKTLCGPDFDWSDTDDDGEENEDVAIA